MAKVVNTAEFRQNLPLILRTIAQKKKPILIGRFSEPKAVLIDIGTFSWQQKVLGYLSRLDKLNTSEIETLEILLDEKTRELLFSGLDEIKKGNTITLESL